MNNLYNLNNNIDYKLFNEKKNKKDILKDIEKILKTLNNNKSILKKDFIVLTDFKTVYSNNDKYLKRINYYLLFDKNNICILKLNNLRTYNGSRYILKYNIKTVDILKTSQYNYDEKHYKKFNVTDFLRFLNTYLNYNDLKIFYKGLNKYYNNLL